MGLVVLGPVSNKTCTQWNRLRFSICATEQMLSMQEIQLASAMDAWLLHREVIFGQLVNHQKLSNLKGTVVPLHAFIIPFIPITAWLWWSVGLGNCIYEPPSKTWSLPKKKQKPPPSFLLLCLVVCFLLGVGYMYCGQMIVGRSSRDCFFRRSETYLIISHQPTIPSTGTLTTTVAS